MQPSQPLYFLIKQNWTSNYHIQESYFPHLIYNYGISQNTLETFLISSSGCAYHAKRSDIQSSAGAHPYCSPRLTRLLWDGKWDLGSAIIINGDDGCEREPGDILQRL